MKLYTVGMRNAILGNDLQVAWMIEHERKRCIHSMQRFIHCLDTDDDLARVHLTTPKLAPQSRLADLGNTVIPERPIVSQKNSVPKFSLY